MKIEMDEVEKAMFHKLCDQVKQMNLELCGGTITKGFVKEMTEDFAGHIKEDTDNFKKVLERMDALEKYKRETQLFAGWSKKAIFAFGSLIAFIFGLIQFLYGAIFR